MAISRRELMKPVTSGTVSNVGASQYLDPKISWRKYCGFLDISTQEFLDIQEQLLLEQIDLVSGSPLGRRLLRGTVPNSVA